MTTTSTRQLPKTPSEKHAQARQAQTMSRLGGMLVLLLLLGVPAVGAALLLYALARKNRRRLGIVALGMLVGLVVVGLGYQAAIAEVQAIVQLATPYQGAQPFTLTPARGSEQRQDEQGSSGVLAQR